MKTVFLIYLLMAISLHVLAQQPPRLIVRGDDMGSSQASNAATIEAYKNGIETSAEVIVVGSWFPEAVTQLKENPGLDVGVHLVITSEWDNIKWRPLTHYPGLTDKNGYFLPKIFPDKNYPGLSIMESKWTIEEIEKEFRAQIELALRNIPHVTHISGHMGSTTFDPRVAEITQRLAREYRLPATDTRQANGLTGTGYGSLHGTFEEKVSSFTAMLSKLEQGKSYVFVDHPAYDTPEMRAVHHIGYENVASDRQGVTDLFTSEKVKAEIKTKGIELIGYNDHLKALPRSTPEAENVTAKNFEEYLKAVRESKQELHSLMVLRHGKVIYEQWFGDHNARKNHPLWSVSKTFTATAIGFAVAENRLKVSDKVISFFKEELPAEVSPYLAAMEIRHLLTMSVGHEKDPTSHIRKDSGSWEKLFLATPVKFEPGTKFVYNSMATYMLSAIIQKVTGEKLIDYLYPRLFRPLGITGAVWESSPSGVNCGGWGLNIKTEDMAKMGQFLLQKGKWNGEQLLPETWFDEATKAHITQPPVWFPKNGNPKKSDWVQGYGYQVWRCRYSAFRADGANGQFIIVIPEKDAVVVTTANIQDMQAEINLIWKHLLPTFK
jgi:CubicO group peptidase (beta-lactamase class C family)/predicted glycoside hydrolase/deacetylase ChbG (UPF0249 family)